MKDPYRNLLFFFWLSSLAIDVLAEQCVDDDARIAQLAANNGNADISGCIDVSEGCNLNNQQGEVLREHCCETCAENDSNAPPIESDLPGMDETIQLFLQGGQSNCKGQARTSDLNADAAKYPELQGVIEGVWFAGYSAPDAPSRFIIAPMKAGEASGGKFGPEVSFGERIYSVTGKRTMIVKYCPGGSNVHTHWNPETSNNGWDKDADDGTAQWMFDNAALDFTSKYGLFKNMIYTMRRTEEALTSGGVPYKWAGIVWVQGMGDKLEGGMGDKLEGDPVWKVFGENTARIWEGFRAEIGSDVPVIDTGAAVHNQLKSGKEYATQIVKGCRAKNLEYGLAANDDTESDCMVTPSNPCSGSSNMHQNYAVAEFYGYDPNFPDSMKPPGATDKVFHWYADFPSNLHAAYDGMILRGRMLANGYIREFTDFDLRSHEDTDPVVLFPLPRCDDGILPTDKNLCWIDYRDEALMVEKCTLSEDNVASDTTKAPSRASDAKTFKLSTVLLATPLLAL